MEDVATVYVIDDDASVRDGLDSLLRSLGYRVSCLASTQAFSFDAPLDRPACLVLDIRLPSRGGLAFQAELQRRGVSVPVVFLTGHGDVQMCAQAFKAGAVDFLLKPFREQDLLDAIGSAVEQDRAMHLSDIALKSLRDRFEALTAREKQVMAFVVTGRQNSQVARELGLSEIAIKVNRGHVMRKMSAASFADLVRMSDRLAIAQTRT